MPGAFSGKRLVAQLAAKGAHDPEALAAWIGRRKFGRKAFGKLAAKGVAHAKAHEEEHRRHQALMDRVRPGGTIAHDLTEFSDHELASAAEDLTPAESLRVAGEMNRRDTAAHLPGARADLIGMSDHELAARLGTTSGSESSAIAAEADRRQRVAEVFPGGSLVRDLTGVDDGTLGWAIQYADAGEAERIAGEIDRRYPPRPHLAAQGTHTVAGQLHDRQAIDNALGPANGPDEWAWLGLDPSGGDRESMSSTERWIAEHDAAAQANRGNYSPAQVREMYREHVYAQWLEAENELRGVLLSREAQAAGIDPVSVFSGPSHVAYSRASEELKRWWADHPRTTLAEYNEQLTGQRNAAAGIARKAAADQQNRL